MLLRDFISYSLLKFVPMKSKGILKVVLGLPFACKRPKMYVRMVQIIFPIKEPQILNLMKKETEGWKVKCSESR